MYKGDTRGCIGRVVMVECERRWCIVCIEGMVCMLVCKCEEMAYGV